MSTKRRTASSHDLIASFLIALAVASVAGLSSGSRMQGNALAAQAGGGLFEQIEGVISGFAEGVAGFLPGGGTVTGPAGVNAGPVLDPTYFEVYAQMLGWRRVGDVPNTVPESFDDVSFEDVEGIPCGDVGDTCTEDGNDLWCDEGGVCVEPPEDDDGAIGGGFGEPCILGTVHADLSLECVDGFWQDKLSGGAVPFGADLVGGQLQAAVGAPAQWRLIVKNNEVPLCSDDVRWTRPPLSEFVAKDGAGLPRVFANRAACVAASARDVTCCVPAGVARCITTEPGLPLRQIQVKAGQTNPCSSDLRNDIIYERAAGTPPGGIACSAPQAGMGPPNPNVTCGGPYRAVHANVNGQFRQLCVNYPVKSSIMDGNREVTVRRIWPPSPANAGPPQRGKLVRDQVYATKPQCDQALRTASAPVNADCTVWGKACGPAQPCCQMPPFAVQCRAPAAQPGGPQLCLAPAGCIPVGGECTVGGPARCCGAGAPDITQPGKLTCLPGGGIRPAPAAGCCLSRDGVSCESGANGLQQAQVTLTWARGLQNVLMFCSQFGVPNQNAPSPTGTRRPFNAQLRSLPPIQTLPAVRGVMLPGGTVGGNPYGAYQQQQQMMMRMSQQQQTMMRMYQQQQMAMMQTACQAARASATVVQAYMQRLTAGFVDGPGPAAR